MLNIHRCVVGAVAALLVSGLAGAQTPKPSPAPPAALRPAEIIQASLPATVFIEIKRASGTEASGSGFIIDPSGIILTNLHVIRGAVSANVSLQNGDVFDRITVRVVDEARDIAIIQVPGFNLPTVQLADSDTVMQGDFVVLLGSPLGLSGSGTTGIVSAIRTFEGSRLFQTDAAANPGNSGGPMLNEQGADVGILTFGFEQGENLNFAVAVNYARGLLGINNEMSLATLAANYPETVPDPQPVVASVVEPPDAAVIAPVAQAPGNADDEPTSITADAGARAAAQVPLAQRAPQTRQWSMRRVLGGLALVGAGVAVAFYSKSCETTGELSEPLYLNDGVSTWTYRSSGLAPLVTDGRCGVDFNIRGIETGNYTGTVYNDEIWRYSKLSEQGDVGANSPIKQFEGTAAGHSFYPKGRMYAGLDIAAAGLLVATFFSDVPVVNSLTVAPLLGGAQVNASLGF